MKRIDFKGLFTNADLQDLGEGYLAVADNVFFKKPGKVSKRPPRSGAFSHPTGRIRSLYRLVNEEMPGGAIWIAIVNYDTYSAIEYYDDDSGAWATLYGDSDAQVMTLHAFIRQHTQSILFALDAEQIPASSRGDIFNVYQPIVKIDESGSVSFKFSPRTITSEFTVLKPTYVLSSKPTASLITSTFTVYTSTFSFDFVEAVIASTFSINTSIVTINQPGGVDGIFTVNIPAFTIT